MYAVKLGRSIDAFLHPFRTFVSDPSPANGNVLAKTLLPQPADWVLYAKLKVSPYALAMQSPLLMLSQCEVRYWPTVCRHTPQSRVFLVPNVLTKRSFRFESDSPFGPGVRDDNAAWSAFWSREPDQVCSSACACAIRCLVLTWRLVLQCYAISCTPEPMVLMCYARPVLQSVRYWRACCTDKAYGPRVLCHVRY